MLSIGWVMEMEAAGFTGKDTFPARLPQPMMQARLTPFASPYIEQRLHETDAAVFIRPGNP